MPTLSGAKTPGQTEDQQRGEDANSRKWRLRPPQKAMLALLAAGLVVPQLEASLQPKRGISTTLARLDREYDALTQKIERLRKVPEVGPTFKTLLYVEQATEKLVPETWAALPGDRFPEEPHRYLLLEKDFVDFLSSKDSMGAPKLSPSDAVRVYSSALVASRVFHIPPSLLVCLLLQESRMSSSAISPTGAEGAGQLTQVAIDEVDSLLTRSSRWRARMRLYEDTMSQLYADPTTIEVMRTLVPDLRLPVFSRINGVKRFDITDDFLKRVRMLLEKQHPELAESDRLRQVCLQIRSGERLTPETEPIGRAYRIAATELYNVQTGNTFNPETNVAVSAMLFRHYMRYPWSLEGERLTLPFSVRCALAVLAYNQGPRAGQKVLKQIAESGMLALEDLSVETLLEMYSAELVQAAIGNEPGMRSTELFRHFEAVMSCALKEAPRSQVLAERARTH